MRHDVRPLGVALAAAALLLTSGCGARPLSELHESESGKQQGPDTAPAADKAASVINAIKPDPALTAALPSRIRSKGLRMSTSEGYPPMEMFAADQKTIVGLDPSLARAIARRLGVHMTVSNEDFNAQIPGLITKRYDMVMTSMTDNPERQQKVTFVDYVLAGAAYLVKKGNPTGIQTPEDLCGKTVSVVDNGSSLELATGYDKACKAKSKPKINVLKFPGDQDALLAMTSGRAQANITDYVVAAFRASDPKTGSEAVPIIGTESPWGIAMNPTEKPFIDTVRKALQSLITSGDYQRILKAWNLDKLAVKSAVVNGGK
ncbi:ABC transporter substrate-binding protein [Luteipulveratus mongoliensis]|uniref:Amino acid ABC transporter n=1 Tax=Luteipulveratus mongoliensis TaxID=571913 RepID=A0A0K1JMZ3_9MICO|nr:ABC transporter substrate-binding protein [Luteipulveratus mongoliensis]AKU18076.1 amino acid ABC transporter [Luteipulveratus mongoliensis]